MSEYIVRRATLRDIHDIAHHRYAMFRDMGSANPGLADVMHQRTIEYLRGAIPSGEYTGWLAVTGDTPPRVVAGAGVQRRRVLPRFNDAKSGVIEGRQAIVLNVFTEPLYRRRGLAHRLMLEVMEWARDERIESLVLHAAPDGRSLYEALGFKQTNEMKYAGDLATWVRPPA